VRMKAVVSRHRTALIGLAVALVIVAGLLSVAMAQPAPQQDDQGQDEGRRGRDMRPWMMRGAMGGVAIAVSEDAVFVFARNTLYKFDAETLELLAQAELPMPERQPRQ